MRIVEPVHAVDGRYLQLVLRQRTGLVNTQHIHRSRFIDGRKSGGKNSSLGECLGADRGSERECHRQRNRNGGQNCGQEQGNHLP